MTASIKSAGKPDRLMDRFVIITVCGWAIYAALTLLTPHRGQLYGLNNTELYLLQCTIVLPLLVIWIIAASGASRFLRYAHTIRENPDGRGLHRISVGLLFIVAYFVLNSLTSSLRGFFVGTPYLMASVGIANHVPMLAALVGFTLILAGSVQLSRLTDRRVSGERLTLTLFPYAVLLALFGWLFFTHITHASFNGIPNFALPDRLPFFTMAIPYLVMWLEGVMALVFIVEYASGVKGRIYRHALFNLVRGIAVVILLSVILQLFGLANSFVVGLDLRSLLGIIYLLLIMLAVGFVFIARGAGRLIRIEEVV